ncbi:immunoglobulin superfamily member 3-like [Thunnus thynnus]|uniref:immunoglobulin superfamily member 3-like n=1 Tax=Thunnus thynnus TaxID=8237 RepID=UPI003528C963
MERHPVSDHETSKGEHVESKQDGAENGSLRNTTDTLVLVIVITVQLGEPANLTCAFPNDETSNKQLHWYKQSAGDTLKLIVKLFKSAKPDYGSEFSLSRVEVHKDKNFRKLTILKTTQEDEGMYHCAVMEWMNIEWSATYLLVKGNTERTSNYTVVQWPTVSDPVRPGDSVTLQCSILSDSENKTCPGVHSVYWYKARSDASHPDFIYTDGSSRDECRNKTGFHSSPKSCVYRFSKNVISSDAGTYYCAVATCGEILFGNGTKLELGMI